MKVTAESKKTFQPIKLTIEIENQSELEWYKALFGVDKNDVENIYFNKGLYPKVLERRLLRLNRNTLIEAPKDLEEKDEADYIRMKKIEFNIK